MGKVSMSSSMRMLRLAGTTRERSAERRRSAGGWDKGKDIDEAVGSRLLSLTLSDRRFSDKEISGDPGTGTGALDVLHAVPSCALACAQHFAAMTTAAPGHPMHPP